MAGQTKQCVPQTMYKKFYILHPKPSGTHLMRQASLVWGLTRLRIHHESTSVHHLDGGELGRDIHVKNFSLN
ncbi:hypothetical protein C627_06155 [Corynebacterium glutamicum ZL-6]|nr:hypothetical protein C627_06155 [Corynebacterium glutamicum ZL-6]PST76166.1 hypothetical protein I919_06251 [Corynebacterium glutamicum ZL-2]